MDIISDNLDTLPLWKDKDESWLKGLNGNWTDWVLEFAVNYHEPSIINLVVKQTGNGHNRTFLKWSICEIRARLK